MVNDSGNSIKVNIYCQNNKMNYWQCSGVCVCVSTVNSAIGGYVLQFVNFPIRTLIIHVVGQLIVDNFKVTIY